MGLDIHVYKNITKVEGDRARKVLEHPDAPSEGAYEQGCVFPWINEDFPGREEGLEAVPYDFEGDWHFRAGSYSGHYRFREHLCTLLGLGDFKAWITKQSVETHGPLEELINFSDCEGTIGPVVATKLAKDFVDLEEKAREYSQAQAGGAPYFWETYQNWKRAFADAAGNGFVVFT